MNESVRYSIIIPFKEWNVDLEECLDHIAKLQDFVPEVILLPDNQTVVPDKYKGLNLSVIPTTAVSPSIKRDRGAAQALGQYLVFIDDDAYPTQDWLCEADQYLNDNPEVAAIGGPATTPCSDGFWSRVSGAVFLSRIGGGFPQRYVPIEGLKEVDDWPSVNLIVRKDWFDKIGGFDSSYWPGEDTKLCHDLVQAGGEIHYVASMRVFHHRRASLKKHLRQVGNYGFHRGLFARKYPETSRKIVFFIPSAYVIFLTVCSLMSIFFPDALLVLLFGQSLYGLALMKAVWDIKKFEPVTIAVAALPYIFLTHIWYGVRFCKGFLSLNYKVSLGR